MNKTKKVTIILICVLLATWLVVSLIIAGYNALPMIDQFFYDFSDYKSDFTLLADMAMDYYNEGVKNYRDLRHVAIGIQTAEKMYIFYSYGEDAHEQIYVEWDEKIKASYDAVDKAMFTPEDRSGEGSSLMIRASQNQVEFKRQFYSVTYRSDLKKPDTDRYYVLRLSGLHWYHTYAKDD